MRTRVLRTLAALAGTLACGACMQETVRFHAAPSQQAITRDGQPALVSQKKNSLVMIRPAARHFESGGRPVFVIALRNLTGAPLDFQVRNIAVAQAAGSAEVPLQVFSYEDLVAEEQTRQVISTILAGAAAGANTALAAQEGYRTRTTTVVSPAGSYSYQTSTYSPYRARTAMNRAMRQNERLINAAIRDGNATLAALEHTVIKDNTLMPGEWYGGGPGGRQRQALHHRADARRRPARDRGDAGGGAVTGDVTASRALIQGHSTRAARVPHS